MAERNLIYRLKIESDSNANQAFAALHAQADALRNKLNSLAIPQFGGGFQGGGRYPIPPPVAPPLPGQGGSPLPGFTSAVDAARKALENLTASINNSRIAPPGPGGGPAPVGGGAPADPTRGMERNAVNLKQTFNSVAEAAMRMGRGIAQAGLIGEENTQKMLQTLIKTEATINILRGGIGLYSALATGVGGYAAAAVAAFTAIGVAAKLANESVQNGGRGAGAGSFSDTVYTGLLSFRDWLPETLREWHDKYADLFGTAETGGKGLRTGGPEFAQTAEAIAKRKAQRDLADANISANIAADLARSKIGQSEQDEGRRFAKSLDPTGQRITAETLGYKNLAQVQREAAEALIAREKEYQTLKGKGFESEMAAFKAKQDAQRRVFDLAKEAAEEEKKAADDKRNDFEKFAKLSAEERMRLAAGALALSQGKAPTAKQSELLEQFNKFKDAAADARAAKGAREDYQGLFGPAAGRYAGPAVDAFNKQKADRFSAVQDAERKRLDNLAQGGEQGAAGGVPKAKPPSGKPARFWDAPSDDPLERLKHQGFWGPSGGRDTKPRGPAAQTAMQEAIDRVASRKHSADAEKAIQDARDRIAASGGAARAPAAKTEVAPLKVDVNISTKMDDASIRDAAEKVRKSVEAMIKDQKAAADLSKREQSRGIQERQRRAAQAQ